MTTPASGPLSVPEFPTLDTKEAPVLSEDVKTQLGIHARAINSMSISSGGSPGGGTITQLNAGNGITLTPSPIVGPTGTIAVSGSYEPALTATDIGYGSASNLLTGTADFTYTTASATQATTNATSLTRTLTETTDSTVMTETKIQPFHAWQITNKVRTPGNIGAILANDSGKTVTSWIGCTPGTGQTTAATSICASIWVYLTAINNTTAPAAIFDWSDPAGSGHGFNLLISDGTGGIQAGWITSFRNNANVLASSADGVGRAIPSLNAWHNVVVQWTAGSAAQIYVDNGALYASTSTTLSGTITTNSNITILNRFSRTVGGQLTGKVDEFQVCYGAVYASGDRATLYNSGAGTRTAIVPSGGTLTSQYHFDEAAGTTSADSSGNGNTLTMGGTANPSFTTGLIVGAPVLSTVNVIKSQDGDANNITQLLQVGDTGDTVNLVGTNVQINGSGLTHPLLDANFNSDTLAGTVVRGDIIVGNSTPKWARKGVGASGNVLYTDATDALYAAIDNSTITAAMTDVTNGNVTSTKHGFAPKSPANAAQFLNGAATPAFAAVTDANLSVSDVTTNNVTSTAHGFAPKSPANAAQFLNGAATPAFAAVTDANLSVSDITTNNVSGSAHGFAPKNDGNAAHFLDGTGAYTTPGGGGGNTAGGPVYAQTTTVTVATSAAETSLVGSGAGSPTFAANFFSVGMQVDIYGEGTLGNLLTPTIELKFKLGTVTVLDTGAQTMSSITGTQRWFFKGTITCRTTGGTGTVFCQGQFTYFTAAGTALSFDIANTGTSTIDTTATQLGDLRVQWGTSSGSNTISCTNLAYSTTISLLTVPVGGTGTTTLTNHGVIVGQGTAALVATAVGATNTVLHGNTGADPTYSAIVNADITNGTIDLTTKVTGTLPIANGGTGVTVGAMVRLAQVVTSSSASTVAFSSISASYTNLQVVFNTRATGAVGDAEVYVKMNTDTTAANYQATQYMIGRGTTPITNTIASTTSGGNVFGVPGTTGQTNPLTFGTIMFPGYAGTTLQKGYVSDYGNLRSGGFDAGKRVGQWLATTAINALTFTIASGSFLDGSIFTLYGLP